MKKTIVLFLVIFGFHAATAQVSPDGTPIVNPPAPVLTKFGAEYSNIKPTWEADGEYYAARYSDKETNLGRRVVYDTQGNIISTDYEIDTKFYPASIGEYYTKNYPKEEYSVWTSKDAQGNRSYYSKRGSNVIRFDKNGRYVSTVPEKQVAKESSPK